MFQPLAEDDPRSVAGYRISSRLGSGGMGKVYLSYTPGGRPVAIKVIRPEFAEDADFRRRFQREVRSAQRVQGLYTAPVIDSDTEGPTPWLATAYVPGPSVAAAVAAHGPIPVGTVLLLVAGIAEALQVIHHAGIVHRDLKPSNVLLSADGPRVIDFGIARAADTTALTGTGAMVGTPSFMAPEQVLGAACTAATDIFALGQLATFAATGTPAFGDGSVHAVLYRIAHEEPDLSRVPEELREIITGCLHRDAGQRLSTARIIELCGRASQDPALRRPDGWLPSSYDADLTQAAAPTPPPQTPPPAAYAAPTPPPQTPQTPQTPQGQPAQAAAGYGYPATQAAGHAAPQVAHAPTQLGHQGPGYQGPGYPGATGAGGYPSYPTQGMTHPQQGTPPRPNGQQGKGKRAALVLAAVAVVAVVGAGAYLAGKMGADSDGRNAQGGGKGSSRSPSAGQATGPAPGQSSEAPSGGEESTAPAEPEAAGYEKISIPAGYALTFGDDPPRPEEMDVSYEGDFGYASYAVGGRYVATGKSNKNTMALQEAGEPATLEGCRANTRYTTSIEYKLLTTGSRICVKTGTGHYGLVTVLGFAAKDSASDYVNVDLTVWRNVPAS
ncbi:serine/threonine-protein kinase [Streptomyces sp. NPDC093085]|uniref:serine/threonine-protein kinase n=1 Tax=Streptomyces sp. NPDC093085 TaxID=3155068 RepID=UPI00344AE087